MAEKVTKTRVAKPVKAKDTDKPKAVRKPRVAKKEMEKPVMESDAVVSEKLVQKADEAPSLNLEIAEGRYIYATGRRKTAVANVRLFSGKAESSVNKKPATTYLESSSLAQAIEPLRLVGGANTFYFYANISGGGKNSQVEALRHGIAQALGSLSEEVRKIMKKNGFLTRDDRKKERKKPGLKRARRSPQWAKR